MRNFSISRTLLLTGFLIALAFNPIAGQQPTQIERDAIRSACRSDFLTNRACSREARRRWSFLQKMIKAVSVL